MLKNIVDLYFVLMAVGFMTGFISKEMAFVKYNVQIAQFTFYPWFVVPIVIAMRTRPFWSGTLYVVGVVTFIAIAVGTEYIKLFG